MRRVANVLLSFNDVVNQGSQPRISATVIRHPFCLVVSSICCTYQRGNNTTGQADAGFAVESARIRDSHNVTRDARELRKMPAY